MLGSFDRKLLSLKGGTVRVSASGAYPEPGQASILMVFSDGTKLRAAYWRIIKNGRASVSSFDHNQKYGLPAPIDAIEHLTNELRERVILGARHEKSTGDLWFKFDNEIDVQILNFTGYEIWQISFPDGTGEYSNYAK